MAQLSDEELLQQIDDIFHEFNETAPPVTMNFSRENDPAWDSVTHLNLMMGLEMKFGIKFNVVEMEAVQNMHDLIAVIRKKTA
jgi:acyl carrier protein